MKKIIYSLIFVLNLHCTLLIDNCVCQWVQKSNGMGTNKFVWSIAVSGNNIFAGTNTGVYLSTNNGEFWSLTSLNNQSGNILLINGNNIYTGTGQGVFLSTNNGQNWTHLGLNNNVWALAINGSNIFAGTNEFGVYRSTDNGANWTQTSLNNKWISSLVISGNNIFAGDLTSCSVFRSTNNGDNWTQIPLGGSATDVVSCLAVNGNNFFAGTDNGGVFRSTNYGLNWALTNLMDVSIMSLTTNGIYIFAGAAIWTLSHGGVFLSSDNGESWILKKQGMSNGSVWSLATTSQYIFAGTDSSVWRRDLSEIIGIQNISSEIPSGFVLYQNYPNPFNPTTNIRYELPKSGFVNLVVFDALGREIQTLVNESLKPGSYEVSFDGGNLPSGVYFYQIRTLNFTEVKRMVLLK
jgi:hypothetical protein